MGAFLNSGKGLGGRQGGNAFHFFPPVFAHFSHIFSKIFKYAHFLCIFCALFSLLFQRIFYFLAHFFCDFPSFFFGMLLAIFANFCIFFILLIFETDIFEIHNSI